MLQSLTSDLFKELDTPSPESKQRKQAQQFKLRNRKARLL
jgi:hypothetical protein